MSGPTPLPTMIVISVTPWYLPRSFKETMSETICEGGKGGEGSGSANETVGVAMRGDVSTTSLCSYAKRERAGAQSGRE